MAKTKTARKALVIPSLQDRIAALRAAIDETVARHVDTGAKECGSIPPDSSTEAVDVAQSASAVSDRPPYVWITISNPREGGPDRRIEEDG
jgi:hypothetical protein